MAVESVVTKPKRTFIVKYRPKIGALIFLLVLPIMLCTGHSWGHSSWVGYFLGSIGFGLIVIGIFGRLWAMLYIGGKKDIELQCLGPYSVVRHPLYVSSLLLGIGLSLHSQNLLVLILALAYFALQYRTTILHEEMVLTALFGETFTLYKRMTPCFIPRLSNLNARQPEMINLGPLYREFLHCLVALAMIPFFNLLGLLHDMHVLPTLLKLP